MAKRRRKAGLTGLLSVLLVAGILGGILLYGNVTFNGDDVLSVSLADSAGAAVNVTGLSIKKDTIRFTPSAGAAVITLNWNVKVKDIKDESNSLVVDISGLEPIANNNVSYWRIVFSDGTNEIVMGTWDIDQKSVTVTYDKDDLSTLSDFSSFVVKIKFYDINGNLEEYVAGNIESALTTYAKVSIRTENIQAFLASVMMLAVVSIKRALRAIGGVFGAFLSALYGNALIVIAVGIAVLMVTLPEFRTKAVRTARRFLP